jgi:hypothetical protein
MLKLITSFCDLSATSFIFVLLRITTLFLFFNKIQRFKFKFSRKPCAQRPRGNRK